MKKGIAYYRISTLGQEENSSLEDQKKKVEAFCISQDIKLVAEFSDISSGSNCNRSGYQNSLDYLAENNIDCYIILKLDRVHRHQQNLLVFESNLREQKINLISVTELIDTSSAIGKLMFQVLGSFAEFERSAINDRTRSGRKAKIDKADFKGNIGGNIALGYEKEYVINNDEAIQIQDIFSRYLKLCSIGKLIKYCNEKGYKSKKGLQLSSMALSNILRNRIYLGEYSYKSSKENIDIVEKNHHEKIINPVLFGKVQAQLKRNLKRQK